VIPEAVVCDLTNDLESKTHVCFGFVEFIAIYCVSPFSPIATAKNKTRLSAGCVGCFDRLRVTP
jgi:hypothetical protein